MSIYMYFKPEAAREWLTTRTFRASSPTAFNDPFDCQPILVGPSDTERNEIVERNLRRKLDSGQLQAGDVEAERNLEHWKLAMYGGGALGDVESYLRNIGPVLCFTRTAHHLLMWSHYAERHTGLLVEFDEHHVWFAGKLFDVVYSDVRPTLRYHQGVNNKQELLRYKALEWSYEQEVRMCLNRADEVRSEKKGTPEQGRHWRYYFRFSPNMVKSVTLGMRCRDKDFVSEQIRLFRDEGVNVAFKQSSLSRSDYRVEFKEIELS